MKQDCINYDICRFPVHQCNSRCEMYNKTCWDCKYKNNDKCDISGQKVYEDSEPCYDFIDK